MQSPDHNGPPIREEGHISLHMDETEDARERRRTTEFERGIDPSVKSIPGLRDAVLSKKSFVAPSGDDAHANLVCEL
jgi:hypothetical protein